MITCSAISTLMTNTAAALAAELRKDCVVQLAMEFMVRPSFPFFILDDYKVGERNLQHKHR